MTDMTRPYILAVGSHKGGTGRTSTAAALAAIWGRQGRTVMLIDADPQGAAGLLVRDGSGRCRWPNVGFRTGLPAADDFGNADLVVVDAPPLTESAARPVLARADAVVLTCLADPLCLRTVRTAAEAIARARGDGARPGLAGIILGLYRSDDDLQAGMLDRMRRHHAEYLLEPPIPCDPAWSDWPLSPGAPLPDGAATEACGRLAAVLAGSLGLHR